MKFKGRLKRVGIKKVKEKDFPPPQEIKLNPQIICSKCKQHSGYENEDFTNIKPPRDIKCKHCGQVCIKIRNSF